jgi:hypothetical protein
MGAAVIRTEQAASRRRFEFTSVFSRLPDETFVRGSS